MTTKEILANEYTITEQQVVELWKRAHALKLELLTKRTKENPERYIWIQNEARKTIQLIEDLA